MNAARLLPCLFVTVLVQFSLSARCQIIQLPNAYAHNDYWHKRPLYDALNNGFSYVEADVFLRNDQLIVAHTMPVFGKKKTLEQLYLKPLSEYAALQSENDRYPVTLMIDIKSGATKTYEALLQLLEKYRSILSSYENGEFFQRSVTIVITGHKPMALIDAATNNRIVFADEDLRKTGRDCCKNLYPIASCKYSRIVKWKGKGLMPDDDRAQLKDYVAQAHANGRKVRLWASPENKTVWKELLQCNVDLINTNKLEKLKKFLTSNQAVVARAR